MLSNRLQVDPRSAVPKYHQLYEILRRKIDSGEWQPHESIPPERELENLYNVSRTTIREALNRLANEGYIYREHGRGTFVGRPKLQYSLHLLQSFTNNMRERGCVPGQQILELARIVPPDRIRQQLELSPAEQVIKIERLRYADDEPIGHHVAYLPLAPDQTIGTQELLEFGSLYGLLESKFGLIPVEGDETLEATIAGEREAALLEISIGSPLLLLERITFSQQRQPMEFVKMLYRADRYKYHLHITH